MHNCGNTDFAVIKGGGGCPLRNRISNTKSEFKKKNVLNGIFTVDQD